MWRLARVKHRLQVHRTTSCRAQNTLYVSRLSTCLISRHFVVYDLLVSVVSLSGELCVQLSLDLFQNSAIVINFCLHFKHRAVLYCGKSFFFCLLDININLEYNLFQMHMWYCSHNVIGTPYDYPCYLATTKVKIMSLLR